MAVLVDILRLLAQPEPTENRTARGTNTKETENNHSSRLINQTNGGQRSRPLRNPGLQLGEIKPQTSD